MKLLVIGSGGREHALAWKLAQSPEVSAVYVAPGNAGTAREPKLHNLPLSAHADLMDFCRREGIALPWSAEAPLAADVVRRFSARPACAVSAPRNMRRNWKARKISPKPLWPDHGIPTAHYQTFESAAAAHDYVAAKGAPIVIKADGLAAGKGVIVALSEDEAHAAIDDMLLGNKMGNAGARVVIEDFLQGEEASFIVMVDGEKCAADGHQPRPQAPARPRSRGPTRAAWAPTAPPGGDALGV